MSAARILGELQVVSCNEHLSGHDMMEEARFDRSRLVSA
jgi:hypothetical protein